jgi:tetratricopeptide (TPR) repeat protein
MEKAFKEFEALFQSEIRFALYHTEFAKILRASGNTAEAKKHLQRALSIAPDFPPAKQILKELAEGAGSPKSN